MVVQPLEEFLQAFDSTNTSFGGLSSGQQSLFLNDFHFHLAQFAPPVLEQKTHSELLEAMVTLHQFITLLVRYLYTPITLV